MKIRKGFVSNSSSSCFLILGIKMNAAQRARWEKDEEERDYTERKDRLCSADEDKFLGLKWSCDIDDYRPPRKITEADYERARKLLRNYLGEDVEVALHFGIEPT